MSEIRFSTGVVEMPVNGGRTIRFNPADIGFLDTLYGLLAKVDAIDKETARKREKAEDLSKVFDYMRASDKRMREAVDGVFGEGFSDDVFNGVRLVAPADGLSVLENFVFAVFDQMDESVTENMARRSERIAKYTARYEKYRHNESAKLDIVK